MKTLLSLITLLLISAQSHATDMYMARSASSFPETMSKLQETIKNNGYKVSRVQRVDIGLTAMGYKTDKYRVVFYGKPKENAQLIKKYPSLIPYLPLKIAIFAEAEETLLVATSPKLLSNNPSAELKTVLARWEKDLQKIISTMREDND